MSFIILVHSSSPFFTLHHLLLFLHLHSSSSSFFVIIFLLTHPLSSLFFFLFPPLLLLFFPLSTWFFLFFFVQRSRTHFVPFYDNMVHDQLMQLASKFYSSDNLSWKSYTPAQPHLLETEGIRMRLRLGLQLRWSKE